MIHSWLQALLLHVEMKTPLPSDIQGDPLAFAKQLKEKSQPKLASTPAKPSLTMIKEGSKDDDTACSTRL